MKEKANFMEPLFERAEVFGKTSLELLKLKALDKISEVVSTFVSRMVAIIVLSLFTIFANIALALWLGDLLGKTYYGFLCVAGFYGLITIILFFFTHNLMKKSISNSIISQMLN